jgi:transposase
MDMRLVETPERQSFLVLHRTRRLFIRQQIAIINSMRAHLAEFGIGGRILRCRGVEKLIVDSNDARVPEVARACIAALGVQLRQLETQILELRRWQNTIKPP